MKRLFIHLCFLLIVAGSSVARASDAKVSLEDILLLSQDGMSDQTILVFVQNREIGFTMNADEADRLLQAGVSEEVIQYLIQRTAPTRTYTSRPVTFVDPYPAYYYTPYYAGTALYLGFSSYPHHYYGYYPRHYYNYSPYHAYGHGYYGGGHRRPQHHSASLHPGRNGHGVSHRTYGRTHGVSHGGGRGHVASVGHNRLSGVGHGSRSDGHSSSVGHSSSSGVGHGSSRGAAHSSSGSGGHGSSSGAGHSSSGGHGRSGGFSGGHGGGGH